MPIDLIIRDAHVVTPEGVKQKDLFIDGGRFVGPASSPRETIDAKGLTAYPGLIDSHVHFNEPGRTDWEGIATGSAALAAGGGVCFFDMPLNSSPPTLDGTSFDLKVAAAKASSVTDFGLWGGLTPNNLDRLAELADRGVVGFKAFMCNSGIADFQAITDLDTLERGMEIAAKLGRLVAVHAENDAASDEAVRSISQGRTTARDYLQSRGPEYENRGIADAIGLAAVTGCRLHIVHVSQPMGVDLVREAQSRGVKVTCETCPHYLLLCENDLLKIGPSAKCAPPLRPEEMVQAMWERLRSGSIDFVASDHSPSPESMKGSSNFFEVWGGIAGVQSTLGAMLSAWPRLPRELVGRLIATNVAARFGVPHKGKIAYGFDADLTLVDEHGSYQLSRDMLVDRHKLSPYVGRTFRGVVKRTIVRGQTVFLDGRIVSKPIGQLVKPEAA